MPCKICKERPVIKLTNSNIWLCKNCFIRYFEKKVLRTIRKYNLLDKGDKVLVCVSGGKDSTALLYLLNKLRLNIKIEAIVIDPLIGDYTRKNIENLKEFCKENQIKLHHIGFRDEFGYSLCYIRGLLKKKGLDYNSCTICGILRRYLINKYARKLKVNKVATGHNLDDEAQSFLMNVIKNNIEVTARLGPKTGVVKSEYFIPRVKPLYFLTEEETTKYSKLRKFKVTYEKCPCSAMVFRRDIERFLNNFEKKYPGSKHGIVNSFLEILPLLKERYGKGEIELCKKCKEPCSLEVCKTCEILGKMRK